MGAPTSVHMVHCWPAGCAHRPPRELGGQGQLEDLELGHEGGQLPHPLPLSPCTPVWPELCQRGKAHPPEEQVLCRPPSSECAGFPVSSHGPGGQRPPEGPCRHGENGGRGPRGRARPSMARLGARINCILRIRRSQDYLQLAGAERGISHLKAAWAPPARRWRSCDSDQSGLAEDEWGWGFPEQTYQGRRARGLLQCH